MIPSLLVKRTRLSSDSPICLIFPQIAYVLFMPVIRPVVSSTSAMLICTEAWSFAATILLLAEHFLGIYISTKSPASFCIVTVFVWSWTWIKFNSNGGTRKAEHAWISHNAILNLVFFLGTSRLKVFLCAFSLVTVKTNFYLNLLSFSWLSKLSLVWKIN